MTWTQLLQGVGGLLATVLVGIMIAEFISFIRGKE